MNVREPHVSTSVTERELLVVDPHLVQDSSMDVMDIEWVGDDRVAEFIGFAEGYATLKATASHEERVAINMMVAPAIFSDCSGVRSTAHLSRPKYDSLLKHAPFVEVGDECGDGLIGDTRVLRVIPLEQTVLVPR